jgi:hypothetical protein
MSDIAALLSFIMLVVPLQKLQMWATDLYNTGPVGQRKDMT